MSIPVYSPGLTVTLIKMVSRKDGVAARYTAAQRTVDLTQYLGESGAVQTTKTLRGEPAGAFSISFGDRMNAATRDSLYAQIEPMDMLVIRAAREPQSFNGGTLPLIMRGFVSAIRRTETIGEGGEPRRSVVISGHDFGKLWMIHSVWFELAVVTDQAALTVFGLQTILELNIGLETISDFMTEFTTKVMNPKIEKMTDYSENLVPPFLVDASVKEGSLVPSAISHLGGGTFWHVIAVVSDQPWNELFVRDEEEGPHLVFRPAPFKGSDGKMVLPDAADPGSVDVSDAEVVQWDVSRSDSRVANFFWVPPGSSSFDTNQASVAGSLVDGSALDFAHPNNDPVLYGEKKMEVATMLIPSDIAGMPSTLPAGEREAATTGTIQWYRHRALELQAMNRDNSVFEDGTAVLMGREDYVIGTYLRLTRGTLESEAYVTSVAHNFQPMNLWTTTVTFERGTGFLERNKLEDSPYIGEGRRGPYST